MKKRIVTTTSHIQLVLVLILLFLGETCGTVVSPRSDKSQDSVPSAPAHIVTSTIKTSTLEVWSSPDFSVRDALILDGLVLLSNSAPLWGRGPGDGEPYIAVFDLQARGIVWKLGYAPVAPIVANSQNLFVIEETQLLAVDLNTGDEKWSAPLTNLGLSQVFCDDALVLITNGEALYAFDAASGKLRWESDLPIPLDSSVPLFVSFTSWREHSALSKHDDTVFARRLDHQDTDECHFSLFALDVESGRERWRFQIQQSNHGECLPGTLPLSFGDGLVLVGTWDDFPGSCVLNALDEDSGEIVWSYQIAENCSTAAHSIFIDEKFVFISAEGIHVLQSQDGHLLQYETCLPGGPHQLISSQGWAVCRSEDIAKTHSIIDLHSWRVLAKLDLSPLEICKSASSVAGFSNNQLVLVAGSCIRSFDVETSHLEP